jgi:hydroxyacylglutathione hydrolase
MILRQVVVPETACASYLFGCTTHENLAVVDPQVGLVEDYLTAPAGPVR